MYLDKNKILSSLTDKDVAKICSYFGYPDHKQAGEGVGFNTALCHRGDSPYKLVIYPPKAEQKYYRCHCFTCGESYNIVELVIRAARNQGKKLTWFKALNLIAQLTNNVYEMDISSDTGCKLDFRWLERIKLAKAKKFKALPKFKHINENILDCFYYDPDVLVEWVNEGISAEVLGKYEIGFNILTNQITIPHRDWRTNEIIGIRGRYVLEEDASNFGKYVPMLVEGKVLKHSLGTTLYGLWLTKESILKKRKIMLVEGEKSVLQAHTYFGDDNFCAATCGSNITQTQMRIMLQELQVEEVLVAFDREYHKPDSWEAELYWQKLIKKVAPLVPFCKVYLVVDMKERISYKGSPTDCGKEVLLEIMKEKILITQKDVEEVVR